MTIAAGGLLGAVPFGVALLADRTVPPPPTPVVTLSPPFFPGLEAVVRVESADPPIALRSFRATLASPSGQTDLDPLLPFGGGPLRFQDDDFDQRLSRGDSFFALTDRPGLFVLRVFWKDILVANATWHVPLVVIEPRVGGPPVFEFEVVGTDQPSPLTEYRAEVLSPYGTSDMSPLANGTTPNGVLEFRDLDGDGRLSVGDWFAVNTTGPGGWQFIVHWGVFVVSNNSWYY